MRAEALSIVSRWLVVIVILGIGGCARRPPAPTVTVPVTPAVDVTALVRHGCFRCLERALDVARGEQAFEVAALLTLRAKELGLPYAAYRARAEEVATVNPAFATYLEILDAVPVDGLTGERYQGDDRFASATRTERGPAGAPVRLPSSSERAQAWREALPGLGGSGLFRAYVAMTISCTMAPRVTRDADGREALAADGTAPLLRYRAGICDGALRDSLKTLRDEDPDFVDADLMLGRYALGGPLPDLDEALTRMQAATDAFPDSILAATILGGVRQEREEWADALAAFDGVLRRLPEHRDALLGRIVALSHLKRHAEAIASATRMVDLGAWFLGEAYYWRAWNEFSLQQYPASRVDVDRAKTLMVNAAVFVLSGLVEWNQRRLPTAESEFEEALKMDFGRCDAARYLGVVRVQRSKVPEALAAFKQAIQCYDLSIRVREKMIADVAAGPGTPAMKARRTGTHQRIIDEYEADRAEAARNAAALEKRGTLE